MVIDGLSWMGNDDCGDGMITRPQWWHWGFLHCPSWSLAGTETEAKWDETALPCDVLGPGAPGRGDSVFAVPDLAPMAIVDGFGARVLVVAGVWKVGLVIFLAIDRSEMDVPRGGALDRVCSCTISRAALISTAWIPETRCKGAVKLGFANRVSVGFFVLSPSLVPGVSLEPPEPLSNDIFFVNFGL